MKYLKFLIVKLRGYSILTLIRLELEALIFGFFSIVPTVFGVVLRVLAAKLFFKKIQGFPWIQPGVTIIHSDRIVAGSHLGINTGTYINGVGEIEFGNHVLIGNNVTISSGMHPTDGVSSSIFSRPVIPIKITIKDDVWIGAGATIMPGIILAKGTVIGANSLVNKNTEEYTIYAGVPAKKIGSRQEKSRLNDNSI